MPPASTLYDEDAARAYSFHVEAARMLLTELGCEDTDGDGILERRIGSRQTEPLAFTLIVSAAAAERVEMAQRYAATLSAVGLDVTVSALDWSVYQAALAKGDYDLFWAEALPMSNFDPGAFALGSGAFQYSGYQNDELSGALDSLRSEGSRDALSEVYRLIHEQMPFMTVLFRRESVLTQRGLVSGLTPTHAGPFANWSEVRITQ